MEDIKDRLGEYKYNFFNNLQNYLDSKLYFYGSIKRSDYFGSSSDIDIIVITDNVKSMMSKIQNYLNINKNKIQTIFQQHSTYHKGIITGYKIKYKNKENDITFDLLIYDEKNRKEVLQRIHDINNLPLYIVFILYTLKILCYLYLLSKSNYIYLKSYLFYCYFNGKIDYYDKKNLKENSPVVMLYNL